MKVLLLQTVLLLALASACGGGGGTPTPVVTTDNTPQIDPNLLPGIVLQASEVPPGFTPEGGFKPPGGGSASSFTSQGATIASSVVQYQDPKSLEVGLDHLRRSLAGLIGRESGYQLAGADVAFLYREPYGARVASVVVRGRSVINVNLETNDPSAEAAHVADVQRYTELVFGRLQKALVDPASITPVAGAPTLDPNRLTPTPPTTGTP